MNVYVHFRYPDGRWGYSPVTPEGQACAVTFEVLLNMAARNRACALEVTQTAENPWAPLYVPCAYCDLLTTGRCCSCQCPLCPGHRDHCYRCQSAGLALRERPLVLEHGEAE